MDESLNKFQKEQVNQLKQSKLQQTKEKKKEKEIEENHIRSTINPLTQMQSKIENPLKQGLRT